MIRSTRAAVAAATLLALAGCAAFKGGPAAYGDPQPLVAPSAFKGVHGLAIDAKGRLLAGSVVGNAIWEVDRDTGAARVFVAPPEGQADDIAIGPKGEMAWTSYLQGVLRYRESDTAPVKVLASNLPGINSLAFDRRSGKLYATQVFLGDALWEIDLAGGQPRQIAKGMGGLNGFEVGPDGWIYGPLWFKGQVAKVDPRNGELKVVASGFKVPAAANFDSKGRLWVIDTATGELVRVDVASGAKTRVAQLKSALDNLAIDAFDRIYVSNMADNSVEEVDPATGASRTITRGAVAVPGGIKLSEDGRTLYVADIFSFRTVDTATGAVTDVKRMQASDLEYPFGVGLSARNVLLSSWFTGNVQVIDRATLKTRASLHGFTTPTDVVELPDGSLLVSEVATGAIKRAAGDGYKQQSTVVAGLAGPVQMILGRDGKVYVTEAAGRLTAIDPRDWSRRAVAEGLALPEGLAQRDDGMLVVAEAAARRLVEIDPATGTRRTIAQDLPIGFEAGPGLPPSYVPTGVAVARDGTVYFSADRNNAIYRLPMR